MQKGRKRAFGRTGKPRAGVVDARAFELREQDRKLIAELQEAVHEFLTEKFNETPSHILCIAMLHYSARIAHQTIRMPIRTFSDAARTVFKMAQRELAKAAQEPSDEAPRG